MVVGSNLSAAYGQTIISPADANIRFVGRFDLTIPTEPVFGWSGTAILANFQGTSLSARFDDEGDNHLYYIIDDGEPISLDLESHVTDYLLARDLNDGVHRLEIGKKTEGTNGEVKFLNLQLDAGKSLTTPPALPALKLVFFGDSNQAGYSAESIHDQGDAEHEDSYFTYPAITARMLGAEYDNISASGITVSNSSFDWDIQDIWNKTYYGKGSGPTWNFTGEKPNAVVVNLGANDFYAGQSKSKIKQAWKGFIRDQLRTVYPEAHVVLANSYGWAKNEPADYVQEAVEELHQEGDTNVSFVLFPWFWSQAHAVTFEHAGFANILAKHLARKLGLEQPLPNSLSAFAPPGQVANGSFEDSNLASVPDGWRYWGSDIEYVEQASDAHDGNDYVRVSESTSGFWHANEVTAGHEYELTGWLRAANSTSTGKLVIQFKNQAQQILYSVEKVKQLNGKWQQVSFKAKAPLGAWQAAVSVRTEGRCSVVDFDSLSLRDLSRPPLDSGESDTDVDVGRVGLGNGGAAYGEHTLSDANSGGKSNGIDSLHWQLGADKSTQAAHNVRESSCCVILAGLPNCRTSHRLSAKCPRRVSEPSIQRPLYRGSTLFQTGCNCCPREQDDAFDKLH